MALRKNKRSASKKPALNIVNIGHDDQETWDFFVQKNSPGNLLQSFLWGDFKQLLGFKVKRYELTFKNKLVGTAQIIFQRNPLGYQTAVLSRGPVVSAAHPEVLSFFIQHLAGLCRAQGCMDLIIEPLKDLGELSKGQFVDKLKLKPYPSIQPHRTLIIDISKDTEELLAAFKPKTRYNIKLAEKKGVTISQIRDKSRLDEFYSLLLQTAKRQNIRQFSRDYFSTLFDAYLPSEEIIMLSAKHKKDVLASLLLLFCNNTALYLFGATSDKKREYMANYLLHFEAMRLAKENNCDFYDFWGIALPSDAKYHDWSGISKFKQGFGGENISYPNTYRKIFRRSQSQITALLKKILSLPSVLMSMKK